MEIKFEVIKPEETNLGDIFYCTPDVELNEFGEDVFITGSDQIFIVDDHSGEDEDGNYEILVNGGWTIVFKPNQKVVRLAHYQDILRILDMVKLGHPDMDLGANDSNTIVEEFLKDHPEMEIDLLAEIDINEKLSRMSNKKTDIDEDYIDEDYEDEDDDHDKDDQIELPF